MAPELHASHLTLPNPSTDIYCFGGFLYELLERKRPYEHLGSFDSSDSCRAAIREAEYTLQLTTGPEEYLSQLMKTCMASDPVNRGTMKQHCAHLTNQLGGFDPLTQDFPEYKQRLFDYYSQFAQLRNQIYDALRSEVPKIAPDPDHSLALAIAGYKRNHPLHTTFELTRGAGAKFLGFLIDTAAPNRRTATYLADSGLTRALNVFHFIMPLEVLNFIHTKNRDPSEIQSWADLFERVDTTVVGWQFWLQIASIKGWNESVSNMLRPTERGVYPTRKEIFNEDDIVFLDTQEARASRASSSASSSSSSSASSSWSAS